MDDIKWPQNINSEEAVLGDLLIDPDAIVRVAPILENGKAFFRAKNGWVYDVVLALNERREAIDFLTVCDELERRKQLDEIGGAAFITSLINATPTSIHVEYHARIVERCAKLRTEIKTGMNIASWAMADDADPDEVASRAQAAVLDFAPSDDRGRTLREHLSSYYDRVEELQKSGSGGLGLPTGFDDVDKLLGGIQGYVLVAGRPSQGKSAFVLDLVRYLVRWKGQRVAYFSLEDSAQSVVNRLVAKATGMDIQKLRDGRVQDWPAFMRAMSDYGDNGPGVRLWIDDSPTLTVQQLTARAWHRHAESGVDLIIVDYLQLMRSGDQYRDRNEYTRVSDVSDGLKALGRLMDVPVLAVSQLSRKVEERANKRPILSDLRESGTLEQAAEAVIFLYRDEYYNDETEQPGIAEIAIAKNKHGPTGKALLVFEKECARFRSASIDRKNLDAYPL